MMSSKHETSLLHRLHSRLPKTLHHEKMHNPYTSGTPDVWYSGTANDLWVEYKCGDNTLSPLQTLWLTRRLAEGRNLAVIHSLSRNRNVILQDTDMFLGYSTIKHFTTLDDNETAQWILSMTMTQLSPLAVD